MTFTYTPGPNLALAHGPVAALLDPLADEQLIERLWSVIQTQPTMAELLSALAPQASHALADLPSFALAIVHDDGAQVVVRGNVSVEAAGGVALSGEGLASWREEMVPGAQGVVLQARGASDGPARALLGGVVNACRLAVMVGAAEAPEPSPEGQPPDSAHERPGAETIIPAWMTEQPADATPPPATKPAGDEDLAEYDELWDAQTVLGAPVFTAPSTPGAAAGLPEGPPSSVEEGETGLPQALAASEEASGSSLAIRVLGVVCDCGLANPPRRSTCSGCGLELMGEARAVDRPALGRAVFSTGQAHSLDHSLIIGRKPRSARFTSGSVPVLVTVASPSQDISRTHLMVELADWSVHVVDLGATNGTILRRKGQRDRRLQPRESVLAVSGDVYDLGDGVELRLHGIP
ncbi:MAG: FHA domain-containing protein [Micrococcales bacterium]|nr:FHA domain-containing protein [Micrococcales bacterium]